MKYPFLSGVMILWRNVKIMPLKIQNVLPRSLASKKGIKSGEILLSVNGNPLRDFIDLQYYSGESYLACEVQNPEGKLRIVEIIRQDNTALGIEPEPYQHACCHNKCVFCFIDQMPPNLRSTLYVKDDDYLFSFVFGNYITLTNLSEQQFQRIIRQKLSPMYISVHTTNAELRKSIMGYRKEFDLLSRLRLLSTNGISIHAQIVLVPDWNDKAELIRTLDDLLDPSLQIMSVGIVPVGLTKHRDHLSRLRTLTDAEAVEVIRTIDDYRCNHHLDWLYASDEIYIQAKLPIPEDDYYGDYPQIENGIGLISLMLQHWKLKKRKFINEVKKKGKPLIFVTGFSAAEYIRAIAEDITKKAECCPVTVVPIINNFMGESVTVSGLLTWFDIKQQVVQTGNEIIVLPGNIFNHDGITLDGFTQLQIKEHWCADILIIDPLFEDWEWL
jgi:putative radical SAM enzyme (TIGR03279 family)